MGLLATAGTSTLVGIPSYTDHWVGLLWAVIAICAAHFYQTSRFGLSLRVSREDEVAAKASGVNIFGQRLIAFVISAFFVGVSGALYLHFLGTISVEAFYIDITLLTLAMLVVGGMNSLSGAVVGVGAISLLLIEVLRQLEHGFTLGSLTVSAPGGTQEIGLGVAMLLDADFPPERYCRQPGDWLVAIAVGAGSRRAIRRDRENRCSLAAFGFGNGSA